MRRLGAEEPYMNQERRDDTLSQISAGRVKQTRVQEVLSSIPQWADRPFKNDQADFDAAYKTFQAADPIVSAIEMRLMTEPGPIWRDLSPEERTAFANWTASINKLEGYVNSYFPTELQQRTMEYILWGIAVTSFVLPLFLSDGEGKLGLPFKLEPLPLPPGLKPRIMAPTGGEPLSKTAYRPMTSSGRPSFMPTSFSKIPAAPGAPLQVKAEVLRPATAAAPWRTSIPAPASGGLPTPGFRSFVKPLGPSGPVTPGSAQAVATGTTTTPPSESHNPRIYPKPQFRRQ